MNLNLKTAVALLVTTGAIKVWQPGEVVSTTDLNAALAHIHGKMVGGHGARLVDADVAANANIAVSKLATNRKIPIAWGATTGKCTGTPCTIVNQGLSSITRASTGSYRVNMTTALTDLNFDIVMSATDGATAVARICYYVPTGSTTSQLVFVCDSDFVGTRADAQFSFAIFDDN